MTDVFISYAREDRPFVQRLHDALANEGRDSWVDWEGIPASAKWMAEVRAAIDASECFCFVVSPDSVESPVCREEAAHAAASNKRILPLVHRDVSDGLVPETVAVHNWIRFTEQDKFDTAFGELVRALQTEPEHLSAHTRILVRAKEWESNGKDRSFLLRGRDLEEAERWLSSARGKEPVPTQLHTTYVLASRKAASSRQRGIVGAVAAALVVSMALGSVAVIQRNEAARRLAESLSREMSVSSASVLDTDAELGLLLAIEAAETAPTPEATQALREALSASRVRQTFEVLEPIRSIVSPDGRRVLTVDGSFEQRAKNRVRIWDAETGRLLAEIPGIDAGFDRQGSSVAVLRPDHRVGLYEARTGVALPVGVVEPRWDPHEGELSPSGVRWLRRTRDPSRIDLVDARSGKRLASLRTDADYFSVSSFAPDGRRFVTGDGAGIIRLQYARTGDLVLERRFGPGLVDGVAFPPRGDTIALTDSLGVVRLWDPSRDQILWEAGAPELYGDVVFSEDGSVLATGTIEPEGVVRVYEARTGFLISTLRGGGSNDASLIALSRDGSLAAAGGNDAVIRVWEVSTGRLIEVLRGHTEGIQDLSFTPTADRLLSASPDGTTRLWDVRGSRALAAFPVRSPELPLGVVAPDGRWVVVPEGSKTTIIDAASGGIETTIERPGEEVTAAAFSQEGQSVATAWSDGTVSIRSSVDWHEALAISAHDGAVRSVEFDPVGMALLTTGADGQAKVWDATNGELLFEHGPVGPAVKNTLKSEFPDLVDEFDILRPVPADFSPDGSRILTLERDGSVQTREAGTWEKLATIQAALDGVFDGAAFGSDASLVLINRSGESDSLWNGDAGEEIASFPWIASSGLEPPVWSPEGTLFATIEEQGIFLRDARTGEIEVRLTMDPNGGMSEPAFSPDGRFVATAGEGDRAIHIWDVQSGQQVAVLRGQPGLLPGLAFSPDGRFLASADGSSVWVWDASTWRKATEFVVPVSVAGFAGDGHTIVASGRRDVYVLGCDVCAPIDNLLALARSHVTRELTPEERATYLGDTP